MRPLVILVIICKFAVNITLERLIWFYNMQKFKMIALAAIAPPYYV